MNVFNLHHPWIILDSTLRESNFFLNCFLMLISEKLFEFTYGKLNGDAQNTENSDHHLLRQIRSQLSPIKSSY